MKSAERLIADLDSSQFALREAAGRKLAELGEQAKSELRRALAGKPSAEVPGIFPGANYHAATAHGRQRFRAGTYASKVHHLSRGSGGLPSWWTLSRALSMQDAAVLLILRALFIVLVFHFS